MWLHGLGLGPSSDFELCLGDWDVLGDEPSSLSPRQNPNWTLNMQQVLVVFIIMY